MGKITILFHFLNFGVSKMKFYVKEMLANECHRHSFYGEFFLDEINFAIIIVSLHTHADTISLTLK